MRLFRAGTGAKGRRFGSTQGTRAPRPAAARRTHADRLASGRRHPVGARLRAGLRDKADRSPVTAADEASEKIILDGLSRLFPEVPVVSEEAAARPAPATLGERFFLVDPLDGTREFIAGENEYTVNIALIVGGNPIAGIIAAPALATVWRGIVGSRRGANEAAARRGCRSSDGARPRSALVRSRRQDWSR